MTVPLVQLTYGTKFSLHFVFNSTNIKTQKTIRNLSANQYIYNYIYICKTDLDINREGRSREWSLMKGHFHPSVLSIYSSIYSPGTSTGHHYLASNENSLGRHEMNHQLPQCRLT